MLPAQQKVILVEILELIAKLEREPPDEPLGARQAAYLIREGRPDEAIRVLRMSTSGAIAATGWLIESHLESRD